MLPKPNFIPGSGNPEAKLFILGEAPGKHEDEEGYPFVDSGSYSAGHILNEWLNSCEISRQEVFIDNVVPYRPPDNDFKRLPEIGVDLNECQVNIRRTIRTIKPNCVLALGEHALNCITVYKGISKWRGSILNSVEGYPKVVATFHPAAFLHAGGGEGGKAKGAKYSYIHICKLDVARAWEESRTRDIDLPKRNLWYATTASQVVDFFERNRSRTRCAVDVETYKQGVTCIGFAFNSYESMSVPIVRTIKDVKVSDLNDSDLYVIWRTLDDFFRREDIEIIGQNFKFDQEKLEDLGFRIKGKITDLMLIGHCIQPEYPSKKLQFWQSIYTREPYHKDEGKLFDPKKDRPTDLLLYNAKDAVVTKECFEIMWKELNEDELCRNFYCSHVQKLHALYMLIESVGFELDLEIQKELHNAYEEITKEKLDILYKIAGHYFNINSPKQVSTVLFDELKVPRRNGTDEKTLTALLANAVRLPEHKLFIITELECKRLIKALNTYVDIKGDYDGRVRTSYNICGTETGRSSTSKPDEPVRPEPMGLSFQTVTKRGIDKTKAYKGRNLNIRRMIKPWKDHIIVELDYKNAEGFIVAHLANDKTTLELMRRGFDMHRLTSSWFFGKKMGDKTVEEALKLFNAKDPLCKMEDVDKDERFIGKSGRHGITYGEGKRGLMNYINSEAAKFEIDVIVSEYKCGKFIDIFKKFSPRVFNVYHKEIEHFIGENGYLRYPSGAKRTFLGPNDDKRIRDAYNTIPQGTTPYYTQRAGLRAWEELGDAFKPIVEWHDAWHLMCPRSEWEAIAKVVKKYMEAPLDFSLCSLPRGELSIPVECQIYENDWATATEVKL